ncbi:MAG: DNA-protecting protein DprA [Candidatus Liptonbacteria bacterium]|nr:DNA-protecting protein DprA [Candidatus Liptonbacteria bacterium]
MDEAIFYNALNILKYSDYRELKELKLRFGSFKNAWQELEPSEKKAVNPEKEWQKVQELGLKLILLEDLLFPKILREIPWPPFGIYVLGCLPKDESANLAIVGTRRATETGKSSAKKFAYELSLAGLKIISGLALGIDAKSHEGCLEAKGQTLAVLGNGLDYFYPKTNSKLAEKILASRGAIISEYPLGAPAQSYHFLERNRIVSGLSRGVLIIEAPQKSGALVTAKFALDQNREVFVLPGPASHQNFIGSHQLIRAGAELITKPEEILEVLNISSPKSKSEENIERSVFETEEEKIIIETLTKFQDPLSIDKIIELTNLKAPVVSQTLSFLLIRNLVKETETGYIIMNESR